MTLKKKLLVAPVVAFGVVVGSSTAANGLQKKDDPKQASDGRGIDFFDSVYIEDIIGAYLSVATPAP